MKKIISTAFICTLLITGNAGFAQNTKREHAKSLQDSIKTIEEDISKMRADKEKLEKKWELINHEAWLDEKAKEKKESQLNYKKCIAILDKKYGRPYAVNFILTHKEFLQNQADYFNFQIGQQVSENCGKALTGDLFRSDIVKDRQPYDLYAKGGLAPFFGFHKSDKILKNVVLAFPTDEEGWITFSEIEGKTFVHAVYIDVANRGLEEKNITSHNITGEQYPRLPKF